VPLIATTLTVTIDAVVVVLGALGAIVVVAAVALGLP
jgi:hypothetical protein